jgi:predicted enzyme related to lactoylglutathione lyase
VYFGVADTDAAVAKAKELGGSVVDEARDTRSGGWRGSPTTRVRSSP